MPAAQQVALQPAFHGVLAEHLHDAAVRAQVRRRRHPPGNTRPAKPSCRLRRALASWLDCVSSGPKTRKFRMFSRMTSRRKLPRVGHVAGQGRTGFLDLDGEVAEVGHDRAACATARHWRPGLRSSAGCPWGPAPSTRGISRPVVVEQLFRPVAAHPLFQQLAIGAGWWRRPEAGSGAPARSLRGSARPLLAARSNPWGCAG